MKKELRIIYVDNNITFSRRFRQIAQARGVKNSLIRTTAELEEYFETRPENKDSIHYIVGDFEAVGNSKERNLALAREMIGLIKKSDSLAQITLFSAYEEEGRKLAEKNKLEFSKRRDPSIGDLMRKIIESYSFQKR